MLTQYNKNKVKLAIFDLDNTILKIDSDYEMVNYLIDKSLILEKYRKIDQKKNWQSFKIDASNFKN